MLTNLSRLICILFVWGLLFSSPALADKVVLPSEVFTAIMLKALSYDRNIDRQAKDKVVIGIVSPSDDASAQGFASEVKDNVAKVQSTFLLKSKPVETNLVTLDKTFDKAKFEDQLKQLNISVLVVSVHDVSSVNNILQVTKELQVSSVCGIPGCAKDGVGLEIIQNDNKPRMVSNLDSLKQEGSDYNSKFLAMCEAVK